MNHIYEYHKCKQCGKIYDWTNSHAHIFCSIACRRKWQAEHKKPEPPTYERTCVVCGKEFTTRKKNKKCCSHECQAEYARRRIREIEMARHVAKTYICKNCGKEFTPEYGDKHHTFCCDECAKLFSNRKARKGQKRKEHQRRYNRLRQQQLKLKANSDVTYNRIYARDNGVCQICGLPILDTDDKDWSGSISHIVPFSQGGTHTMENCQLAHKICSALNNNLSSERFTINWDEKSKTSNHWMVKYERYKEQK